MFALTIVSAALLASQVVAIPSPGSVPLSLFARQLSIPASAIPSQCQSDCADMLNFGTTCSPSDPSCLCSESSGKTFLKCINCVSGIPGLPADQKQAMQAGLDAVTNTCQSQGRPFSKPLKIDESSSSSNSSSTGGSKGSGAMSVSPSRALGAFGFVAGMIVAGI